MRFAEDQWANGWASIDIEPVEANYFLPILFHLSFTYHFAFPQVIMSFDNIAAEFELLNSKGIMLVDNWTFSIAFEKSTVRDQVLAALRELPDLHFGA